MAAACIHPRGDAGIETLAGQAERLECPFFAVPETGALDLATPRQLLRICRRKGVTIWHGHDYKSDLLGLLLRRWHPMRVVTTVHGFTRETRRTRLYARLNDFALPRCDHVFAVSPPLVEHCRSAGVAADRLTYLPNGIEIDRYHRQVTSRAAKSHLRLPRSAPAIAVVGRLSPEKGVDRALRMLAALRKRLPAAELHLVGDGPQRPELEALADGLELGGNVHWWSWQENPRRICEAMDLLLLPSRTEGLPNAVLEAMALGLPVAATDVGGVRDLLDDGRCGRMLDEDESRWAPAVAELLENEAKRGDLARRARSRVVEHFSFERRMERVLAGYERLLPVGKQAAA